MKRQLLTAFAVMAMLVCVPIQSAHAIGGHGGGHGHGFSGHFGRGFGRGFGGGLGGGFIGGYDGYGWDIAALYRELYNNLPFYALHPPVYYSYPVPRTYGYSPFAYPPGVMTPEIACEVQPVTINNPYVPATKPATAPANSPVDRAAATTNGVQPLVVINPYATQAVSVAQNER